MLDEMLEAREQLQRKLEEMLCKKVTVEFNIKVIYYKIFIKKEIKL